MNFFESQDTARRNTKRLVVYFGLAILSLIIITNLLVMALFGFLDSGEGGFSAAAIQQNFDWQTFTTIGAVVVLVIVAGSIYKTSALSGGGAIVAESLGGRLIGQETQDPDERKALNVVEEMAIASGTPVPPVYLLDHEMGINAFAAGYSPSDAVIGLTKGTITHLDRDELQGVIAHEFSHILHGDMRLNIRLIGILHGILLIGLIGYFVLRSAGRGRSNKNGAPILFLGLGLMAIGFTGTLFGNLIKASVSRQREFLADASAVQYTRNPDGIAGALKKIGGVSSGSTLNAADAPSMSHAFFANGVSSFMQSVFATHPPLDVRIKRVDSQWDGKFIAAEQKVDDSQKTSPTASAAETQRARGEAFIEATTAVIVADKILESVGHATPQQLKQATQLLDNMPADVKASVHSPYGARAVIYALVIDKETQIQQQQLQQLSAFADQGVYDAVLAIYKQVANLDIEMRLPLIEMAIPTLKQLSSNQYALFKKNLRCLIMADQKVSLFEWALQKIVCHHLDPEFTVKRRTIVKFGKIEQVKAALASLLSALIYECVPEQRDRPHAFSAALNKLDFQGIKRLREDEVNSQDLDSATDMLAGLKPTLKPQVLEACIAVVTADQEYSADEVELMRAISMALDCPIPLVPTFEKTAV